MTFLCEDAVKPGDIFREEYRELTNETKMFKHHLDKEQKIRYDSFHLNMDKLFEN